METYELRGINKTIIDLSILLDKRVKEIAKKEKEPFKIVIRGKEYLDDAEILQDWSKGILTRYAMDQGIKAFVDYKMQTEIKVLEKECELLKEMINNIYEQENEETDSI